MVHEFPKMPIDSGANDLLTELMVKFAREHWYVKELVVDSFAFLWMAKLLEIDEPDQTPRILPSRNFGTCCVGMFDLKRATTLSVRVGSSFQIYGPRGPVTIREG